ncbi:hypothetical protein ALC60_10227 [Trachymyrmex zeteki]|uniref:MADF domain-containing protein n=1 Tax=Mycetomoellerius zeteki TaxID=64791 RepID=A0A151WS64_9HYME|nr:hypothetical protein ALC60_10227 [Trachymyrmex zeteki]
MSDIDENDNIDIDDEVLIAIVQQNPCLYAKSDANYKDYKVKEMKWETIAESLNCTANEAKKRWDSLRINSSVRQSPASVHQLSTSVGQSPTSVRQSSTSIYQSSTFVTATPSCSTSSTQFFRLSDWYDDSNASLAIRNLNTLTEGTMQSESTENLTEEKENCGSTQQTSKKHAKRILVPPLDNFAKKRKASNERLEELLCKSSLALYPVTSGFILGRGEVPPLRWACKSLVRHENRGTRVPASEFSSWGECRPLLAGVCQLQLTVGLVTIHLHLPVSPPP